MRAALIIAVLVPATSVADVTVTVDAAADNRPISPLIYGMNFPSDAQLAAGIPVARWGGNSTSRYNYQIDVHNTGNDYFFENLPACWDDAFNYCATPPADPKEASSAKEPVVYDHPFPCGCPKRFANNQDSHDPFDPDCGSCTVAGNYIAPPATPTTSMAITPQWDADWVGRRPRRS